jgi:hypothetical protein
MHAVSNRHPHAIICNFFKKDMRQEMSIEIWEGHEQYIGFSLSGAFLFPEYSISAF